MDPVKTDVKTTDVKNEQNLNTEQDSRGGKDVQKAIKAVSFAKY